MNEIAATSTGAAPTDSEIEVLPPARPMASESIGQLMQHAQAMSAAKQLGDALSQTDMVPKDYKGKPANAAAAILYGAELGLNPIQSLQQVFVVHGQPAIYARTAVALVKRAGVVVETVSSTDEAVTVRATDPRTGQVEESTWDIPRAKRAGYTSNKKYETDPQAMLYAKAAMEVCRRIAPDVLLGIPYAREELELELAQQQPMRVRSERGGRGLAALRQQAQQGQGGADAAPELEAGRPPEQPTEPAEQQAQEEPAASGMSETTRKKWLNRMFALLAEGDCPDKEDQLTVITALAGRMPQDRPEHRDAITDDELRTVVTALNAASKEGRLGEVVTDLIQAEVLRMAEADEAAR
ncbi:hypothetical protein [Mycolicibacterium thermoresistibile]|uniref:RecT-like ssDNA binding protein n=2 Tax=Mycolicibacterium thermoresistibile TaxID=1797 RepID=G7CFA1_MYCT3|nr:hypothetical protein [Mycolicibacterium thermoresistibile]EHI13180.1 hypothetical protein KEK_08362 [Mycolicibacterium thermoresistibile ATCC 19527]MCV7187006.1 hypothetical protein [Mycolicibacterium thermoresistibile]GAT13181.1 putative uncharacterized protein [Mycolicibacterium thermoresistibile]SNW20373.1 RecT-family phage protein [Mycolicibacterium thermoresistibile]